MNKRVALAMILSSLLAGTVCAGTQVITPQGNYVQYVSAPAPAPVVAAPVGVTGAPTNTCYQSVTIDPPPQQVTITVDPPPQTVQVPVPCPQPQVQVQQTPCCCPCPQPQVAQVQSIMECPQTVEYIPQVQTTQNCVPCNQQVQTYVEPQVQTVQNCVPCNQQVQTVQVQQQVQQPRVLTYEPAMVCKDGQCVEIGTPVRGRIQARSLFKQPRQ